MAADILQAASLGLLCFFTVVEIIHNVKLERRIARLEADVTDLRFVLKDHFHA